MDDLISRQAAIKEVHGAIYEFFDICDDDEESPMTYKDEKLLEINKAISGRIKALPSAQPQRMRGEWIDVTKTGGAELWKCSECGELELEDSYFCPNCGADMRGEQDDTNRMDNQP